jgi:tRNA A-37 threonylcarbamoyl transferase component Bud32
MTVDAELANWGEPPVNGAEEALLAILDQYLDKRARGEEVRPEALLADARELAVDGAALLWAAECVEQFVATILEHSGIAEPLPDPFPGLYRFQKCVGEGRFGQVWLADHLRLQIPVALKALHFKASGEARALARAALENEARVLAQLRHPNIVQVYALEQAADELFLVLQYVDGGSLKARLEQEGPLGWQLAARYIADVGEALGHVHDLGIVHRDVKPANLLWDRRRDEALLTDFGLAGRLAEEGQVAGTPLYMAPEAFGGQSSPAGDVYSLAGSLFTLMTGRAPFPAKTRDELLERIRRGLPDPEPLFGRMPEKLECIIRSGLEAVPENRPELKTFVADLRGSLNRLLADSFVLPALATGRAGPVEMRLTVARWEGGTTFVPVAETHPQARGMTRDLTRVPPLPARASLRTGDRVRIEVVADRDGFVTVFNVGPTGHLNLLYPDQAPAVSPPSLPAHRPLEIADVALTPPAGGERLFAIWSRGPLLLSLEELFRMARGENEPVSLAYRATRNMERVQASVQQLRPEDWHAVLLELDHGSS